MIIVTGAAGFIGANVVHGLMAHYHGMVAVCDVLGRDDKWRNLQQTAFDYFIHPAELLTFLNVHCEEIDAIIHMGAISSTTETDADAMIDHNFKLTMALFDWCAEHHKRLIYASSAATYGDGSVGFQDDDSLAALRKLKPLNVYGWSKHQIDVAIARRKTYDRPQPQQCVGLKFFNVYGSFEDHKAGQKSVINYIYHTINQGNPACLFKSHRTDCSDGQQMRDFIWVGDCVDVILWLLNHPNINGLFNVGTGQARSFNDLAAATFNALGCKIKIDYIDMPEPLREKYQYYTQAPMEKLRAAGYDRAFTSLEDGVQRYVQEYLLKTR